MKQLEIYRKEIDQLDEELTRLFEKRMEVVLKVAAFKKENNTPILHKNREEEVLRKAVNALQNKDYEAEVTDFFNNLMRISKNLQNRKINTHD